MNATRPTHLVFASAVAALLSVLVSCSGNDSGEQIARDTGHPVLLVTSSGESSSAETWRTILAERFGGCDRLPVGHGAKLVEHEFGPRELIVISNEALTHFDSLEVEALQKTVADEGIVVLLDRPGPDWGAISGLRTVGSADLPVRWPENSWSVWESDGVSRLGAEPNSPSAPPPSSLELGLEYLVQRPQTQGVRNVGTPFGVPAVWWRGEGKGAWISVGLPLAQLIEALKMQSMLDARQRQRWITAVIETTLNPDIFPQPYLRVWPRPSPGAPPDVEPGDLAPMREKVSWKVESTEDGGHRIQIRGGSPSAAIELAIPVNWRAQVLSNWECDWENARSRRVLGPDREWRLMRAPTDRGILDLRYRLVQNASPWR